MLLKSGVRLYFFYLEPPDINHPSFNTLRLTNTEASQSLLMADFPSCMMGEDMDIRNLDEEVKQSRPRHGKKAKMPKQQPGARNRIVLIAAVVLIAALVFLVLNLNAVFGPKQPKLAATISGQNISQEYVDKLYKLEIPENQTVAKEIFMSNFVVPRILLLQEAQKRDSGITAQDVNEQIQNMYTENFIEQDLRNQLARKGITFEEYKAFIKENMLISSLLANAVRLKIEVPPEEVDAFYAKYKDTLFPNLSLSQRLRSSIHAEIYKQKELQGTSLYMSQLLRKANVIVYSTLKATGKSFTDTGANLCTQDGKPIVRLYYTSACESCRWIQPAFDAAVKEYTEEGRIIAYHWQLDTGDDLLTSGKETAIPAGEAAYFRSISSSSQVPAFSFSCTYTRLGTAFDKLADEEEEFRLILDKTT